MDQISGPRAAPGVSGSLALRPAPSTRRAEVAVASLLVVTGLFVFFVHQQAGIADAMRLALPDSDDTMRLLGVRDLLAGQGWFDTHQYRYLPPDGVLMHWSRLVDLVLGGGILALRPFLGPGLAERVFVTAWPLFLFVVYGGVTFWGGLRLFGARAGGLAVLAAAQMVVFGDLFAAGRIDHHNIQIILVLTAAIGFGLSPRSAAAAAASGVAAALSLAVGLETLPAIVVIGCAFAFSWIAKGEQAAKPSMLFGASLAIVGPIAFALQTNPALWFAPACDALSPPWLLITSGGGVAAVVLSTATQRLGSTRRRLAAALIAASIPIVAFVALSPECLSGPYVAVPEPYRSLWLHDVLEAYSFRRFLMVNTSAAVQSLAPMLFGAVLTTLGAWRGKAEDRPMLALLAALLWLGVVLAQFQIRTVYITSAVFPLAGGWFINKFLADGANHRIASRVVGGLCAVALFGLTWAAAAGIADAFTPVGGRATATRVACNDPRNIDPLAALPPGLVLSQMDLGPNILLHTPHSIVVAGYHRGEAGIIAGIDAFTGDQGDMRRQAEKFHADYVVVCPNWLSTKAGGQKPFAEELASGSSADWLQPVELPPGPLKAWRVIRD
jgi:hypothetical protein